MKRIFILLFVLVTILPIYSQTYLQEGDLCFDRGDYACAITNYNEAFESANGKDKQITEIKLTRAKKCAEHIKIANQAFNRKNYSIAKDEYQRILESNPKDSYVQSQIEKCDIALNPPKLRKATTEELTDIWNNKYGIMPERRQKLIDAGIDPTDAQQRINRGEGKPDTSTKQTATKSIETTQAITLNVSPQNVYLIANGDRKTIDVKTNAKDYQIADLPSWCKIANKYSSWFILSCDANNTGQNRNGWIKIIAGGEEIKINVTQPTNRTISSTNTKSCFNCPNANYPWGVSLGYVTKNLDYYDSYTDYAPSYYQKKLEGFQIGVRFEPLFKYGFGLNTGLFYEYYHLNSSSDTDYYSDYEYQEQLLSIPLHLEYRFNFSRYFNVFIYGGAGIDLITNNDFKDLSVQSSLDYGGGIRIDHIQINIGQNLKLNNRSDAFRDFNNIKKNKYKDLILSLSYMF